jgi:hypothetical protein
MSMKRAASRSQPVMHFCLATLLLAAGDEIVVSRTPLQEIRSGHWLAVAGDQRPELHLRNLVERPGPAVRARRVHERHQPTTRSPAITTRVFGSYSQTSPSVAAKRARWTSSRRPAIVIGLDPVTT